MRGEVLSARVNFNPKGIIEARLRNEGVSPCGRIASAASLRLHSGIGERG
jgi:hypothetical protein